MSQWLADNDRWFPFVLTGWFLLLLAGEFLVPLRRRKRPILHRFAVNIAFSVLAFLAGTFVVRPTALFLTDWTAARHFGLLPWLGPSPLLRFALGFLLMDLTFYYWHLANHRAALLWRFHNVHHIDPDLDVTTAFRFHVVEILYSTAFRIVQVSLLGIDLTTYLIYELFFQAATLFHHGNVRLPLPLERLLNLVIVTPRMHGIHHSAVREHTNANYGVVFRFWDRLHRTLRLGIPQQTLTIGVPAYLAPTDNALWNLISMPFRSQRPYWTAIDTKNVDLQAPINTHDQAPLTQNKHRLLQ